MADNYFKHYPLTSFSNTVAINLLAKVSFRKDFDKRYYTFHPYTIKEGDRPDIIAYLYYGDPGYDWIVYYSNDIVDPYHDWYLDQETFKSYIEDKYGSVYAAQSKVKFYRTNYYDDYSVITPAYFNSLSNVQKNYWTPVMGMDNTIIDYERKKEEVVRSTNRTISLTVSNVGNSVFQVLENVYQTSGGIKTAVGTLRSIESNNSVLIVDNIQGTFANTLNVKGDDSLANATVSAVSTLSTSISSDEINYYVPVTFWDHETEKNEKKKNILLLDPVYVEDIVQQFKQLMSA
jgi:Base plate wedge protein 53